MLSIKNIFSNSPLIAKYCYKLNRILKCIVLVLFVCFLSVGGFFLNVQQERRIQLEHKIQLEKTKDAYASGVVVDLAADIIKREGNIPLDIAKKYAVWIFEAGTKYQVDPIMILSIMSVESRFNHKVVSSGNALGLMQVIYYWHKEKTTRTALFDPKNNIHVGTQIIKEYANRSSNDVAMLKRYNGGGDPVYATKVLSKKTKYETEIMEAMSKSI